MKSFRFSLDRVLDWRRTQLELEENRFRQRAAALAAIDRARAEVEAAAVAADLEVRRWSLVAGADLSALDEFRKHARSQQELLAARRAACARELSAQQAAMLEARRRCRLLERLKDRRWSEWKSAGDRETEEVAAESWLAQWGNSGARRL
jgi:hypothetical protein